MNKPKQSAELKKQFEFLIDQLKKEADILPANKHDHLQAGKMGAYSHCCIEVQNLYFKYLEQHIQSQKMPSERDICRKAVEIEKELIEDKQSFCKASYLMGALDMKNGDINKKL